MSRIAQPSEKVMAVARTFRALKQELHTEIAPGDPGVQMSLIDAAVRIALATDTRDLGIMGASRPLIPCPHILRDLNGSQRCTLDEGHLDRDEPHVWSGDVDREFG